MLSWKKINVEVINKILFDSKLWVMGGDEVKFL